MQPEEKQHRQEERQKSNERQHRQTEELKNAFIEMANLKAGRLVFQWFMDECGFKKVSIVGDPTTGDIHDRGTLYNEARRNVWLAARRRIPEKQLNKIEMEVEKNV